MTLKENYFENGVSAGSNVAIASSDDTGGALFSVVSAGTGGLVKYDDTVFAHGALSASLYNATAGNVPVCIAMADTGATTFAVAIAVRLTGLPSADGIFGWRGYATGSGVQSIKTYLLSDGRWVIQNAAGTVIATSTSTLALNTWYRWEFYGTGLNSAAGAFTSAVFPLDSATPVQALAVSGQTTAVDLAELRFGRHGVGTMAVFNIDDFRMNIGSSTPLGPFGNAGTPQTGIEPGATVTLNGIGSGPWTQSAGSPTVALTGSGATRTFVAPYTLAGTTLTFAYGAATTTVQVLKASDRIVVSGAEAPMRTVLVVP
jgi:hypothetical protein